MDLETRAAETIDTLRTENLRLRDAIGRAEDRIGNVLGALALPLPDRLQVEGLRETLPDIRAELQAAVGTTSNEEG